MGDWSGEGNPRFKGPGSLWKSSWRGSVPYTEMCWFLGFDDTAVTGQWYEDSGGVLPIVPAAGFWLGAVVGVAAVPSGGTPIEYIARNGGVATEGWDLIMGTPGPGLINFTFRVYDGAGITASATAGGQPLTLNPQLGVTQNLFRVFAWFLPPPDGGADGSINIAVEGFGGGAPVPLGAPYVNSTPLLTVGKGVTGDGTALGAPNCLHGLVGGDGVALGDDALMAQTANLWAQQVHAEYQIVAAPTTVLPALSPIAGWRANNPHLSVGPAPDPLTPFVGVTDLDFANALPAAPALTVACSQPSVFAVPSV